LILGWLHIVVSAMLLLIGMLIGMIAFTLLTGIGVASGDPVAIKILGVIGIAGGLLPALLLAVLAIPGIAAGYGLLTRKFWGRVLAIVMGILGLINFPIGTAVGLYTLWVLLQDEAIDYFGPLKPV
jgi:hypothetical protein